MTSMEVMKLAGRINEWADSGGMEARVANILDGVITIDCPPEELGKVNEFMERHLLRERERLKLRRKERTRLNRTKVKVSFNTNKEGGMPCHAQELHKAAVTMSKTAKRKRRISPEM